MLIARVITPFLTLVMCIGSAAQETSSLTSNKEIASYAMGTQIGTQVLQSLQSHPVPLDHEAVLIAIGDILRGGWLAVRHVHHAGRSQRLSTGSPTDASAGCGG